MDDLDHVAPLAAPTAKRPFLGMTILVVEDSRFACEVMRLMCLRSGARIRRADCLRSARRHLQVYRPSAVIVDLGLPDGSGLDLIRDLSESAPRVGVLLGLSGDSSLQQAALDAGADGFLAKPLDNLAHFQQAVLAALPADRRPQGVRVVTHEEISPDPVAYRDDMTHVADILDETPDGDTLDYVAHFVDGVARSAEDGPLADAARELAKSRARGADTRKKVSRLISLVRDRLENRVAI